MPNPLDTLATVFSDSETDKKYLKLIFKQGYVLEIKDKGKTVKTFVFVLNPRSISISSPFAATLTPAEDNTVVAEENGIIIREISFEGTFGILEKSVSKGFAASQGASLTGAEHHTALKDFFEFYSTQKKNSAVAHNFSMVFHSLKDNAHYVVVPRSLDIPRDARTTRLHYDYRIALAAIGEAGKLESFKELKDTEGAFFDAIKGVNEAVNDARAAIADATAENSAFKRKLGNIQVVLNNVGQLVNAASAFASATSPMIVFPISQAAASIETLNAAGDTLIKGGKDSDFERYRTLQRLEAATNQLLMFPDKFKDTKNAVAGLYGGERKLTQNDIEQKLGGATVGSAARNSGGSGARYGGLEMDFKNGFISVVVERTDSIESIANKYAAQKEVIIVINDLRFPYIAQGGGPGVAKPGDRILVPASVGSAPESSPGSDYVGAEDALYGVDLQLDEEHFAKTGLLDFKVNSANAADDAELCSGVANVLQGTRITVTTERGATVFLPDIGISNSVGDKGTASTALIAAVNLQAAILADPRIESIAATQVVLDGDVLTQEITPVLKGGAQGPPLTLSLGKATG